jgi:thiamine biosynthesis protein ThiI
LENAIGSKILEAVGRETIVNLSRPDTTIFVEAKEDCTYVYTQKIGGPGGLPYGCQGSVVSLFSGSPNSCVSTWLLMKRGARIIPMYFEEGISDSAKDSAIRWLRFIHSTLPARKAHLVVVPFKEVLESINRCGQPGFSRVLRQRAMLMAADNMAQEMSALGIVTGDALSGHRHDMERLFFFSLGVSTPIYRPLAGLQKDEIAEFGKSSPVCDYPGSGEDESSCIEMPLDLPHELELSSDTVSLLKSALASRQTVQIFPESSSDPGLPDDQGDSV